MNILKVITDKDRPFTVKIIRKGDAYGLNDCLTHDDEQGFGSMVEFYDASQNPAHFDPEGQFVSRYYISTIMEGVYADQGLCLDGGIPVWAIDRITMREVRNFLFANGEK